MSYYRIAHLGNVPPPPNVALTDDPGRIGFHRIPAVTAFGGTLVFIGLTTAVALVAAPAGLAVAAGMLLIGSMLVAANPVVRGRDSSVRFAEALTPRARVLTEPAAEGSRRTRRARDDGVGGAEVRRGMVGVSLCSARIDTHQGGRT